MRDDDEASNIASDWKVDESESISAKYYSKDQSQAQKILTSNFFLVCSHGVGQNVPFLFLYFYARDALLSYTILYFLTSCSHLRLDARL